jgi:potassium-transporting ATPase potassium-binding subunit
MKLAMIALLVHAMILGPTGLFAATDWGLKAVSNPGAHGFSQILYQFSSASANNGSALDGLGVALRLVRELCATAPSHSAVYCPERS